jgi:polysaccharide biosynthesis transport protein
MTFGTDRERPGHHLKPVSSNGGQVTLYAPDAPAFEDDKNFDLREYWRIIVKHRSSILSVLATVLVATLVATLLMLPEYRATATLQINPEGARILSYTDFEPSTTGGLGSQQFLTTQYGVLGSRSLAEAVVRKHGLADQPEFTGERRQRSVSAELRTLASLLTGALQSSGDSHADDSVQEGEAAAEERRIRAATNLLRERIEVQPERNSQLVHVSFVSFDRELSAQIANAVVREYIESTMQRRYDAGSDARVFLQEQLQEMRIALERSDWELADFARRVRVSDLSANQEMAREGLRSLNDSLETVRQELVQLAGWRELVQQGRLDHLDPVANSATIAELQKRLLDAATEYASLSERFLDDYPTVAETLRRMELLRAEVAAERRRIADGILGRFETLRAQETALERALAEREERIMALNEQAVQYNILRREHETNREMYDGLLQRMKEIGVAAGVQESNIAVIDAAQVPGSAFRPVLTKNLAMASMFGLMFGIGLALLLEFLDRTVRHAEDVERLVDLPVMGLVPLVLAHGQGAEPRTARLQESELSHFSARRPDSAVSEAFRSLRTSLMFSTPEGMPRTLLVTSTSQGEGKSTTSTNLATVLAQNGSRVLLIDADLRRPSLHRDFGRPRSPGLTNGIAQFEQGASLDRSLIHSTDVEGLSVMPAGHSTPKPTEMLSSNRLSRVIAECREMFDFVIIDAPPILGLADAVVLSRMVGGVIVVVAAARTGKENFRVAVRRLQQVQAPLLGVVLNRVDLKSPDYAYCSPEYYGYQEEPAPQEAPKLPVSKAS